MQRYTGIKNVFHLITTLDTGGAEKHLISLVREIDRSRYKLTVGFLKGEGALRHVLERENIPVVNLRMKWATDPFLFLRLYWFLRKGRYDLVHTHLFKADVYGCFASKLAGVPVVVSTKHNEDQFLHNRFYAWLARRSARLASKVIVISDAVARFMESVALFPIDKLVRIHYGIDSKEQCLPSPNLRSYYNIPSEGSIVVCIGRLTAQKGHEYLIKAFQEVIRNVPKAFLFIFGKGELQQELEELVKKIFLQDCVIFAGFREDIEQILAETDLLVLPSLWEGFGMVLLEAMRAGKPIVATNVGAIPEIVEDGKTGLLVPPRDSRALAMAIIQLLQNFQLSTQMGLAGRERVKKCFGIDRMIEETEALYDQLLSK